jgi:hypothetical protein
VTYLTTDLNTLGVVVVCDSQYNVRLRKKQAQRRLVIDEL